VRLGVTGRLVALVMIPVSVMCALAGSVVVSRNATARDAMSIDRGVVTLNALVELHSAMAAQRAVESFAVRMEQFGVTFAKAEGVMGVDLDGGVGPARARAARALLVLGSSSPIGASSLRRLYASIDSRAITPTVAVLEFRRIESSIGVLVSERAGDLEAQAARTHADFLVAALESLRVADGFVDVAERQGIDLSEVWLPAPGLTTQSTRAALARLGGDSADYSTASRRIRALAVPTVVARLDRIDADPRVQKFDQVIGTALHAGPLLSATSPTLNRVIGTVFGGYLDRSLLLDGLVVTATAAVRDRAQYLAASERREFMTWAALAALLSIVSLGVAIAFARSIAKPLRALANYAHAVNEGRLDADPSDCTHRGPRETRVAFGVFIDLVANLQLLDAKANALASCAFDDPVLQQSLPGRLGRSLESSVAVLSGSIVERDHLQTHLAHQATHDSLTGIANRAAALVAIQDAIHRAARSSEVMAVLFFDLNEFKAVNDRYGHKVGDEVLREIAARVSVAVRAGDVVARLGGDEFVVIAEQVAGADGAMVLAHRVLDAIAAPIDVGTVPVSVGAAIGIAMTFDSPEEPLHLLARADAAMYRAKRHDRSAIEIFDAALQRHMIEREDVEQALARALDTPGGGGLLLHYQPVLDGDAGLVVGLEALVRWQRPGHGLLEPDAFIPIAEATSLIIDLDRWVLAEVGRRLVSWSDNPELALIPVAVNISGRHLQSAQLARHLREMLDDTGLAPERLTIEITETVLLEDLVSAAAELDAVRALGIRVAIDDFGTGYTSLAHLQHLPIDVIKIDRSFVGQLNTRRGKSLVRMVTDLGHAIDVDIIAEGVETDQELTALRAIGADRLQGFLLARPLDASALARWIHQRDARDRLSATPS
jgi:diguanylate cyclase (GGDEF)-like protein